MVTEGDRTVFDTVEPGRKPVTKAPGQRHFWPRLAIGARAENKVVARRKLGKAVERVESSLACALQ